MSTITLYRLPEVVSWWLVGRLVYIVFRAENYFCNKPFAIGCFNEENQVVTGTGNCNLGWYFTADTFDEILMHADEVAASAKEVLM